MEERYDEIMIGTSFMRGILAKILVSMLRKNLGCDVKLDLNNLHFGTTESSDTVRLEAGVTCEMKKEDFKHLILDRARLG